LEFITQAGEDLAAVGSAVCDWATAHPQIRVSGGNGVSYPSVTMYAESVGVRPVGVLSLYGSPNGGPPGLEIRAKAMCQMPPYDSDGTRARFTADLQALGVPRLTAERALTGKRPNIPLSQLTGGRLEGFLSLVDRWIDDVRAHAGEPEAAGGTSQQTHGADQLPDRVRLRNCRRTQIIDAAGAGSDALNMSLVSPCC
jgi:hypothetical protein